MLVYNIYDIVICFAGVRVHLFARKGNIIYMVLCTYVSYNIVPGSNLQRERGRVYEIDRNEMTGYYRVRLFV